MKLSVYFLLIQNSTNLLKHTQIMYEYKNWQENDSSFVP